MASPPGLHHGAVQDGPGKKIFGIDPDQGHAPGAAL